MLHSTPTVDEVIEVNDATTIIQGLF